MAKTARKGIKNYSTSIDVDKTIAEIEKLLVRHGIKQVFKEYDEHGIAFLSFGIEYKNQIIPIRIPAKVEKIKEKLSKQVDMGRIGNKYNTIEQARRIGWRLILDWIDSQMTMVELEQKEMIEIFLADIVDLKTKETLFQKLSEGKANQFLLDFKTKF